MRDAPVGAGAEPVLDIAPQEDACFVGIVTRAVGWVLDAVVINFAAIIAGVGAALVLSIFPLAKDLQPAFEVLAGAAYVLWYVVYFVAFWSITGQTLGARVMQIRLVTAGRTRVKPVRAFVRFVGMQLAMLPLFAGYVPILFRRRPFPDWLARTLVLDAPQLSLVEVRMAALRAARDGSRQPPPTASPGRGSGPPISGDRRSEGSGHVSRPGVTQSRAPGDAAVD